MPVQLTLVCQAATLATRRAAFPGDEALEAGAAAKAAKLAEGIRRVNAAWTSPAQAARQTAAAMGLVPAPEAALREIDYGAWSGRSMDEVAGADPAGLAAWLGDPGAAPHGGETLEAAVRRTADWLGSLREEAAARVVAVTHASIVRAALLTALGAPLAAFWRIDVAPLCRVGLQGRGGVWTLRSMA